MMNKPSNLNNPSDRNEVLLPRMVWVSTGGTIAGTLVDQEDGQWRYESAQRSGESLLSTMPTLLRRAQWQVVEPYSIGSQNLELKQMLLLRTTLIQCLADPQVDAILVTHGTDTMEDMLFFLHLTLPAGLMVKPLLFTGAMLPSDHEQADGPRNIKDAFEFSLSCLKPPADGAPSTSTPFGLVMQGLYTAAPLVRKLSTGGLDAFDGPFSVSAQSNWHEQFAELAAQVDGIDSTGIDSLHQGEFSALFPADATVHPLFESMEVAVLYCSPGNGAVRQLQDLNARKPAAVVVAAPGHGNIPDDLIPGLRRLLNKGVHVVRASRVNEGGVVAGGEFDALDEYREQRAGRGCFFESGGLSLAQCVVAARLVALAQVLG